MAKEVYLSAVYDGQHNVYNEPRRKYDIVHRLILSLCAAYRTGAGASPQTIKVRGMFDGVEGGRILQDRLQRFLHGHSSN